VLLSLEHYGDLPSRAVTQAFTPDPRPQTRSPKTRPAHELGGIKIKTSVELSPEQLSTRIRIHILALQRRPAGCDTIGRSASGRHAL